MLVLLLLLGGGSVSVGDGVVVVIGGVVVVAVGDGGDVGVEVGGVCDIRDVVARGAIAGVVVVWCVDVARVVGVVDGGCWLWWCRWCRRCG